MQKDYKILDDVRELIKAGELDIAYKKLRKIYKQSPGNNVFKFELAKLMYIMGNEKLDKSEQYFKEIYSRNHYVTAKFYIAKIKAIKGDIIGAKEMLESLTDSTCAVAAFRTLSEIEKSQGNEELAKKWYKKSKEALNENNSKKNINTYNKEYIRNIMNDYVEVHPGRNKIKHLKRMEKNRIEKEGN